MDGLDPCACNKLRRRAWMASGVVAVDSSKAGAT